MLPYAFALYSIFYFLGGSESGYVYVDRIFWRETVPVNGPFLLLWLTAYCYAQVCIETELVLSERQALMKKNV